MYPTEVEFLTETSVSNKSTMSLVALSQRQKKIGNKLAFDQIYLLQFPDCIAHVVCGAIWLGSTLF